MAWFRLGFSVGILLVLGIYDMLLGISAAIAMAHQMSARQIS